MKAHIVTLPGDYIGPEIVAQAVKVLNAVAEKYGHTFCVDERRLGGASIAAGAVMLSTSARCRRRCRSRRRCRRRRCREHGRRARLLDSSSKLNRQTDPSDSFFVDVVARLQVGKVPTVNIYSIWVKRPERCRGAALCV